jgi:hypothetical protein
MREEIALLTKRVKDTYIRGELRQADSALDDIESLISQGSFANPGTVAVAAEVFFEVADSHLKVARDAIKEFGE